MNILVLGSGGMLGHVAFLYLNQQLGKKVMAVARSVTSIPAIDKNLIRLDLTDWPKLNALILDCRPCIVVNCAAVAAGLTKSEAALERVNSMLPRKIATELDQVKDGSRLIHISTDGVYSGNVGNYSEEAIPDPNEPYGISKLNGEVIHDDHLTIRTSIIGPELETKRHLLEWFLASPGPLRGYTAVMWSGVTTFQLSKFIYRCCHTTISGLVHYSGQKISKYELLLKFAEIYDQSKQIVSDDSQRSDRSLCSLRSEIIGPIAPLNTQLQEMKSWYDSLSFT